MPGMVASSCFRYSRETLLTSAIVSYAATRIFASAKEAVLQRFMEMVILERVREDIHETKKLNVHLFNSLKKALYKPGGFFKGVLFTAYA